MKEYDSKVFQSRLKIAMELQGITTQEQLACEINTSQGIVSRWCCGKTAAPSGKTIFKLCQVLNVSADWLLGLNNNPRRR